MVVEQFTSVDVDLNQRTQHVKCVCSLVYFVITLLKIMVGGRVETRSGHPGHPGHIFSGSDPLYKVSGSDPD